MVSLLGRHRSSPIGIDIGSRSVKLLQFDVTRSTLVEASRWDLPQQESPNADRRDEQIVDAIRHAREGRNFHGRDAVFCLGAGSLFVQNLRVAQAAGDELRKIVHFEATGRLPFSSEEAEIRYFDADDVRQGDTVRREVILLACQQATIRRLLNIADASRLQPLAIDVEPAALLRCYARQFRRDDDQQQRRLFVNLGASTMAIVIGRGTDAMFVKYVEIGGRHLDDAVARRLKMAPADAAALRRHNGDRRADQRDPEITRSIAESIRPVVDRMTQELSLSLRYYSVTFRGQPLEEIVLSGGEANQTLADSLAARVDLPCTLGNPLRSFQRAPTSGRIGQWDVAAGLALREVN